jgi:hypothetical protein
MASTPAENPRAPGAPNAAPGPGPLGLVAQYPGLALAAIAVLVILLVATWRRGAAPLASAERPEFAGKFSPSGDPEIEALIAAINAPVT